MTAEILNLDQVLDESVGGKAYGLHRLEAMGLSVPPAFVITSAASGSYPADLDEQHRRLESELVAVRSSAQGEDGEDASFAGQYETVLNVADATELRAAIDRCVDSAKTERALAYRESQGPSENDDDSEVEGAGEAPTMNVVVQRMVDARCAGVVFTVDPVSARRDLLIIDAVAGLGEALVSGEATPDHYGVDLSGDVVRRQLVGDDALLSDDEIAMIARQARQAVSTEGHPLDLEWAIDQSGELFWLQARPITTLPADLNEFDTVLPRVDDVLTLSNVSEMMPGAVCPLTMAFTGWGIDYGVQHMQTTVGVRSDIDKRWQITASAYGHLFLNLTGNIYMSAGLFGSSASQTAQTICGRAVPELKELPAQPSWKRGVNTAKLMRYCLAAPGVVDRFGDELKRFALAEHNDAAATWADIASKTSFFDHAMAVHIQSSALAGFYSTIVEKMVASGADEVTTAHQAETIRLLAGATDVESAVMLEQLDTVVDAIAAHPDVQSEFRQATVENATKWLHAEPELGAMFEAFLKTNGHRGYRELCVRDPSWGDDTASLIQSMQAAVQGRVAAAEGTSAGSGGHSRAVDIDWSQLSRGLRKVLPKAHDAIRRREHTKSQLVNIAHQFSVAFRRLGAQMTSEGLLPDDDLIFFFTLDELSANGARPSQDEVNQALGRRDALEFQQRLEFPEVAIGLPAPMERQKAEMVDGVLFGRPASRGVVEGIVRVAHTLDEAAALEPGEILVTPITDIGWTPYFSLIGGLVTDLGSSVSHGAVVAREYGLPCIVNTRQGTAMLRNGDKVRLDGDAGCITVLDPAGDGDVS